MEENCASPALDARTDIVVEHDQDIVKCVGAQQDFVAGAIWQFYQTIVVGVTNCVAPTVLWPQYSRRDACPMRHPRAHQKSQEPPPAARRCPVSLPLAPALAGAAEGAGNHRGPHLQKATRGPRRNRTDVKIGDPCP